MRNWEKSHRSPFNTSLASVLAFKKSDNPFQPAWSYKEEKDLQFQLYFFQREPFFYPVVLEDHFTVQPFYMHVDRGYFFFQKYGIWVKILSAVVTD